MLAAFVFILGVHFCSLGRLLNAVNHSYCRKMNHDIECFPRKMGEKGNQLLFRAVHLLDL
jgi:hypothetical protein